MNSDISTAKSTLKFMLDKPIFFYCTENQFSHLSICLAEGFKELGIPFYSNINHWQISPDREEYLFCSDPSITYTDCCVVILDFRVLLNSNQVELLKNLFHSDRKYITVYLDDMDGLTIWNPELNSFDFRFKTHYNSKGEYPSNCKPWIFGLSNRILRETSDIYEFIERKRHLLVNFRVEHNRLNYFNSWLKINQGLIKFDNAFVLIERPLRQISREQFLPLIQDIMPVDSTSDDFGNPPSDSYHYLQWLQTGKRHYPNYYQRLKESAACACFGGSISPSYVTREPIVEWWDSWRFWESLAAGCVTFHVDFDKYGVKLPVMPENWRHYIGIDLDNMQDTVDRIADDPGILEKISREGRQWAIDNYAPTPTALRFLEMLGFHIPQTEKYQENKDERAFFSLLLDLREINLIIFPDWSQSEESLSLDLKRVIGAIATHPDKSKITLLVDTTNISDEDANLFLSSAAMNLLMEQDLDVSDGPEIRSIAHLNESQREALVPRLYARIVLDKENKNSIALANLGNIRSVQLESFIQQNY